MRPAAYPVAWARVRTALAAVLACTALASTSAASEPAARDLLERAASLVRTGGGSRSVLHVELIDAGGAVTTRTVATYRGRCTDGTRQMLVVQDPAEVAGSAFLLWVNEDAPPEMWLWLPELDRPRRVNPATSSERFLGSDFTHEDLGPPPLDGGDHRLLPPSPADGDLRVIESIPLHPDAYGRIVTRLDPAHGLPVLVEYFDPDGALLKVARFGDVRPVGGVPTPFALTMENVQTGHRTEVTRLATADEAVDCDRLTPRWLGRAR